jgi:hypothetical protein
MPNDNALTTDNKTFTSRKLDWIERIISDQRLTDLQKVVAVALSFYFNRETDGGYVKQKVLAKKVGCTRRAVQFAIDALVEGRPYLSRDRRRRERHQHLQDAQHRG